MREREADIVERFMRFLHWTQTALIPGIIGLIVLGIIVFGAWQRGCTLIQQLPHLLNPQSPSTGASC